MDGWMERKMGGAPPFLQCQSHPTIIVTVVSDSRAGCQAFRGPVCHSPVKAICGEGDLAAGPCVGRGYVFGFAFVRGARGEGARREAGISGVWVLDWKRRGRAGGGARVCGLA